MDYFKHSVYIEEIKRIAQRVQQSGYFQDQTVVITGAGGMIGSELTDVLMYANCEWGLNCRIYAVVRNMQKALQRFAGYPDTGYVILREADVNTDNMDIREDVDYFIHAASNTHPLSYAQKPVETILTNTLGTYRTLEFASRRRCRRYLFLSSVEVYGDNRGKVQAFAEDDCGYLDCNTLRAGYPQGKRTGEALCRAYAVEKGMDYVTARLARCYGPGLLAEDTKALSQFLKNGLAGENIVLKSGGMQQYSYLYAADAVDALLFLAGSGQSGEAYNIKGKDSDITLRRLAEITAKLAGTQVVFQKPGGEPETAGYSTAVNALLDGTKIESLGWTASTSLMEGMKKVFLIHGGKSRQQEEV